MKDTSDIRKKMLALWDRFDRKKVSPQDARVHIGFARTVLETHKVEIAAAHLELANIPAVPFDVPRMKVLNIRAAK